MLPTITDAPKNPSAVSMSEPIIGPKKPSAISMSEPIIGPKNPSAISMLPIITDAPKNPSAVSMSEPIIGPKKPSAASMSEPIIGPKKPSAAVLITTPPFPSMDKNEIMINYSSGNSFNNDIIVNLGIQVTDSNNNIRVITKTLDKNNLTSDKMLKLTLKDIKDNETITCIALVDGTNTLENTNVYVRTKTTQKRWLVKPLAKNAAQIIKIQ